VERRWSAARAHLADLAAVRAFVAAAAADAGADAPLRDALVLATDEVCANVLVHAYEGRAAGPLEVTVAGDGGQVRVTIADAGPPFDPGTAQAPDLAAEWQERAVGGLGLHLVRHLVDDVRYERAAAGNRVTLVKRRAPAT
jgi:anti-sigma regulatory factor (Ser/Thr protein kinase)